jgi:PEP-CTERM motif
MKKISILPVLSFGCLVVLASGSLAQTSNNIATWSVWNPPTTAYSGEESKNGNTYNYASGTIGRITFSDATFIDVSYSGEVIQGESSFLTTTNDSWAPSYAYTSSAVSNLPSNNDRIGLMGFGIGTSTLTFSAPVTGLVMNIFSLGTWVNNDMESWTFNHPFSIQSYQVGGNNQPFSSSENTLNGIESSGTITFADTFTELTWNISNPDLTAFTVGTLQSTVPEPSTYALLLLSGAASLWALKRRKS